MQIWVVILAADSAMFCLWAMSRVSVRSLVGTLVLWIKSIGPSLSENSLTGPAYSAAIDLSTMFPFFEIGAAATRIVFLFQSTVVHCYTRCVLNQDAVMALMLERRGGCEYLIVEEGAATGHSTIREHWGCGIRLPAEFCLGVCPSAAVTGTSGFEIIERGVIIVGEIHVGTVLAGTVLLPFLVRSAT